jgi:hypothetical protein
MADSVDIKALAIPKHLTSPTSAQIEEAANVLLKAFKGSHAPFPCQIPVIEAGKLTNGLFRRPLDTHLHRE